MALAIDASSPAIAVQSTGATATVTTASFTPPSSSALLIQWSGDSTTNTSPATPTITDNLGTPLTYTLLDFASHADNNGVDGQAAQWWANVASSAAMTVTVTNQTTSPNRQAALKVYVLTGAAATPVGAHGKGASTSATAIAQNYTAQATGGQGFVCVCDWTEVGAETAGTGCTLTGSANIGTAITYGFVRRTTADDTNTVTNTLNVTLPGTTTSMVWTYAEVVPGAAAAATLPPAAHAVGQSVKRSAFY